MSADPGPNAGLAQADSGGMPHVDARHAFAVQVGQGNIQNIQNVYSDNGLTWTDGFAPPPLVGVSGAVISPYRGLDAFEEDDARFFFGRDEAAAQVLERMAQCVTRPGLLVVSGASGAGKSSLLRAGVLRRLQGEGLATVPGAAISAASRVDPRPCSGWVSLRFRWRDSPEPMPGVVRGAVTADPAGFALSARQAALAQTTAPGRGQDGPERQPRLLIVVDQFEQVFTQCDDESQRHAFITALSAAARAGQGPDGMPAAVVGAECAR